MKKAIICSDIQWDTDAQTLEEFIARYELPSTLVIVMEDTEYIEEDEISDILSEEIGFSVESFSFEIARAYEY